MRKLPADEPPSGVLPDVIRSLRRGFRVRLVRLLVTSVLLAGSVVAATAAATTAAERLLSEPTRPDGAAAPSSAPIPTSAGAPRPGVAAIRVKLVGFTRTAAGGVPEQGQYAMVTGHPDPAVQQRINGVLREPVARPHPLPGAVGGNPATLATDAKLTLQSSWLLSVLYDFRIVPREPNQNWVKNFYESEAVIIDLTNGRRLGTGDLFRPETLTTTGLQTLVERLLASEQPPSTCLEGIRPELRADLGSQIVSDPPRLRLYPQHISFDLGNPDPNRPQVCKRIVVDVPYDQIADLMRPDALARGRP